MFSWVVTLSFLTEIILANKCGYATLAASIHDIDSGQFTVSTNKCQAIAAFLKMPEYGYSKHINGGVKLLCDPSDTNNLLIELYSNPLCSTKHIIFTYSLSLQESVNLFDGLSLTLDKLHCPIGDKNAQCAIDISFAEDCTGSNSNKYLHIAVPPNKCQTLGKDFQSFGLNVLPYEILPADIANKLFFSSLKFQCCRADNSLLVYNYSDTHCDTQSNFNLVRLPASYNGQCFVLGNEQHIFAGSENKASTKDVDYDENVYALSMKWNCDEDDYVDCSNIQYINEDNTPNVCPKQCLKPGYKIDSAESITTEQPQVTGDSKDKMHVSIGQQEHAVKEKGTVLLDVVVGLAVCLLVITIGVCGLYVFRRQRKMKTLVEETKETHNEEDRILKYEPMATDGNTDVEKDGEVDVDVNKTTKEQYVLPSALTTDDGIDGNDADNITLLNNQM